MTMRYHVRAGRSLVCGGTYQGQRQVYLEFIRAGEDEPRVELVFESLHSIDALATVLRGCRQALAAEIEGRPVEGSREFRPTELCGSDMTLGQVRKIVKESGK